MELPTFWLLPVLSFAMMCVVTAVYFVQRRASFSDAKRQMKLLSLEADKDLPQLLRLTALTGVPIILTGLYGALIVIGAIVIAGAFFSWAVQLVGLLAFMELFFGVFFLYESLDNWSEEVNHEIDLRLELSKLEKAVGKITGINMLPAGNVLITLDFSREFLITDRWLASGLKKHLAKSVLKETVFYSGKWPGVPWIDAPILMHWYVRNASAQMPIENTNITVLAAQPVAASS